jgi:hypothetical protein
MDKPIGVGAGLVAPPLAETRMTMIFLHETHAVIGEHESTFEELVRDGYLGPLASDPETKLLWYFDSTHGAGEGYKVVTITGFADGEAYERYLDRVLSGDLAEWMRNADQLRYNLVGCLLVDAGVGFGQDVSLAHVPTDGHEHATAVFRQDIVWPAAGADLLSAVRKQAAGLTADVMSLERTFRPALAAMEEPTVMLFHRVVDTERWVAAWNEEVSDWPGAIGPLPGARRESRLLRTSRWSPLG